MASIEDLITQLPMDQIAQALGVDEATAAAATKKAVPALVQGMQANATSDPARAAALAKAIASHAQSAGAAPGAGAPSVDITNVDTTDGEKIVGHVFGDNTDQVANQLGGMVEGGGSDLFKRLLPMLAPLVMGFLAKSFAGGSKPAGGATGAPATSGGGLFDKLKAMLAGLFGGKKSATTAADATGGGDDVLGGLGDMLGGLLGGGGGDLGDALGGLLGGGSK